MGSAQQGGIGDAGDRAAGFPIIHQRGSARARARARAGDGNQKPWPADKVERWSIDRLIPYAKNARTHTDAQVAAIAASIKEWGWTTPALVGEDGGLIAGHARILAARQRRVRLSATIRTSPGGPRTATTSPLPSLSVRGAADRRPTGAA